MISDIHRASFHMSIGPLYVFFGEVSIQVLCPLFNWIFFGVFISSLYTLDINPLSDVLANMFSHSVGCLFILLMISFAVQLTGGLLL